METESGMNGLDIEYQIDGKSFFGYLADGSNGGRAPGILVVHQANGLSEHTKERTRMLADLGYVAFALDMYGEVPATRERAQAHLATVMDDPSLLRVRASAGFNFLKSCRNVDVKRLAAIGFCFGGSVVLEFVRDNRELACAVVFHPGLNWLPEKDDRKITCKVMACIGIEDPLIPASLREKLIELDLDFVKPVLWDGE